MISSRRFAEVHDYSDFFAGLVRQFNAVHRSTVDSAYPHIAARIQAGHILELRLYLVRRAEKILLAPNDEDTSHENG